MEHIIDVTIKDKVAYCSGARYVCGNSDYVIHFDFDDEWTEFETKTARFKCEKGYFDIVFSGDVCAVPVITDTDFFSVGVYAGNIHTTTPAHVRVYKSILCGDMDPYVGPPGKDGVGIQSVEQTTTSTEDGGINIVTVTKTDGEASTFEVRNGSRGGVGPAGADGKDGKSAYAYAVEGGYTGTETEFAEKLAQDIPATLPNPNALTFTGAVTGSYDGSESLTVEIPSGGSSVPKPLTYDYMPEGYPTKAMGTVTLIEEQELAFNEGGGGYVGFLTTHELEIVEGQIYTVNWDGTEYECVAFVFGNDYGLGNLSLMGSGDDTGEPFLCSYGYADDAGGVVDMFFTLDTSATHTISVKRIDEVAIPMSEEFIPHMNVSAFTNDAGYLTLAALPKYGGETV